MGGKGSGGRNAKPTALKKLLGNPGKRKINEKEPQPAVGVPEMPKLSREAAKEWRRIVPILMSLGILTIADGPALAIYCDAFALWRQARRQLARSRDLTSEKARRLFSISEKSMKLAKSVLVEFGLTPATGAARDVMTLIERGDVDQCSFGFYVRDAEWTQEPEPDNSKKLILVRRLKQVDVFDVSPVTFPDYTQTSVDLRSLFPDGVPKEIRAAAPRDGRKKARAKDDECECDCMACEDGECDECSNENCDDPNCVECPMQDEDRTVIETDNEPSACACG